MTLIFEPLAPFHERRAFSCGEAALDAYFKTQAMQDAKRKCAAVFVACETSCPHTPIGFYTLSAASVRLNDLPPDLQRRLPRYPDLPAIRLGRLAVKKAHQRRRFGSLLVLDAIRRACGYELAWAFLLVDAKHDRAKAFYKRLAFSSFADDTMRLWMSRPQADRIGALLSDPAP